MSSWILNGLIAWNMSVGHFKQPTRQTIFSQSKTSVLMFRLISTPNVLVANPPLMAFQKMMKKKKNPILRNTKKYCTPEGFNLHLAAHMHIITISRPLSLSGKCFSFHRTQPCGWLWGPGGTLREAFSPFCSPRRPHSWLRGPPAAVRTAGSGTLRPRTPSSWCRPADSPAVCKHRGRGEGSALVQRL